MEISDFYVHVWATRSLDPETPCNRHSGPVNNLCIILCLNWGMWEDRSLPRSSWALINAPGSYKISFDLRDSESFYQSSWNLYSA